MFNTKIYLTHLLDRGKNMIIKRLFAVTMAVVITVATFTVSASSVKITDNETYKPGANGSLYFPEDQTYPADYSQEDIRRTEEKLAMTEQLAKDTYVLTNTARSTYTSIPGTFTIFQQQNDWFCVPASVRSVLYYINGSAPSQSSIASSIGTVDYVGTNALNATSYLNQQQSANWYASRSSVTQSIMYSSLRVSIITAKVPALIGATSPSSGGFLPYSTSGHCVVANAKKNDNTYVQCADPLGGRSNGSGGTYSYQIYCPISKAPSYVTALIY